VVEIDMHGPGERNKLLGNDIGKLMTRWCPFKGLKKAWLLSLENKESRA